MTIEIFTSPNCRNCSAAKAVLRRYGLYFVEFDIASAASMAAFRARIPRSRSIPQIIINDEHIGGYDELRMREKSGELGGDCS